MRNAVDEIEDPEERYRLLRLIRIGQIVSTVLIAIGTIFFFLALLGFI